MNLVRVHLKSIFRDRLLYAVFGVAIVMLLSVLALSSFSMRQVQELAITFTLSTISAVLLVVSLLLGASSIWRDIEKRYTSGLLALPISRSEYVLSKFFSCVIFLVVCSVILGLCGGFVIYVASSTYPSDVPIHWMNIFLAMLGILQKYVLLTAITILFSSISTSFYLPFFSGLVVYLCGTSSQEVFEYVTGGFGVDISPVILHAVKIFYYLLPNFSAFNLQVYAVYGLDIPIDGLLLTPLYFILYVSILLPVAIFSFNRRELS